MPSCRSSGVLTASGLVYSGKCKLISIHACEVGAGAGANAEIKVYDNTSAAGKEIARIILSAKQTVEFDMHSVLCENGIFFEEASGAVACSVEFR
tara:strand:- start:1291 stop:1575 length:285 start_codon:yes stop_codon:yes gene_type:complete